MREFEEGLEVLRHVALPPMTHDLLGIALVEFPGLRSVILPSEKSVRLNLRMGMGKYMTLDYPQREQEAFEAEFKERWLKGRREPRSVPSRAYRTLLDFQPLLSVPSSNPLFSLVFTLSSPYRNTVETLKYAKLKSVR